MESDPLNLDNFFKILLLNSGDLSTYLYLNIHLLSIKGNTGQTIAQNAEKFNSKKS